MHWKCAMAGIVQHLCPSSVCQYVYHNCELRENYNGEKELNWCFK